MTRPDEDFSPGDHLSPEERDLEAPAPDAVEQAMLVNPGEVEVEPHRGLEVADWDAAEQSQVVEMYDDDYYR